MDGKEGGIRMGAWREQGREGDMGCWTCAMGLRVATQRNATQRNTRPPGWILHATAARLQPPRKRQTAVLGTSHTHSRGSIFAAWGLRSVSSFAAASGWCDLTAQTDSSVPLPAAPVDNVAEWGINSFTPDLQPGNPPKPRLASSRGFPSTMPSPGRQGSLGVDLSRILRTGQAAN